MSDQTIIDLYLEGVKKNPRKDMFRYKAGDDWLDVSSAEFERAVTELSQGLISLGVEAGDRVALLSENRLEWAMCDLAILATGAIVVPIYPTLMSEQMEYILADSEPTAIFSSVLRPS